MSDPDAIRRLLGPAAPELTCEECFAQLDRYVELSVAGEEADERVPGMHAHLEGCPACAEEFESLRELVAREPGAPEV
jgi:anti-sigma factor RsiW